MLIVTLPNLAASEIVIQKARHLQPQIPVIVQVESLELLSHLVASDVAHVVQPEFEASLEIVRQSLGLLNVAPSEIEPFNATLRQEHYSR